MVGPPAMTRSANAPFTRMRLPLSPLRGRRLRCDGNLPPVRTLGNAASQGPLRDRSEGGFVMAARGRRALFRLSTGVVTVGLVTLSLLGPASAGGIFESLFGGFRRAFERPAPPPTAFADPMTSMARAIEAPPPRGEAGPSKGFCVRTCDGHFFPVQASAGASAADMCRAFCPASETRVYSGSNIDYAVTRDGSRYNDLDKAYLYRKQSVAGCTCNGHDQFGLARIDVTSDPTLKPGDVVATRGGLVAVSGNRNKTAEFTPVQSYPGFPKSYREQLSAIRLMPPTPGEGSASAAGQSLAAQDDDRRSAELAR